jgi:hypothetical protein
MRVAVVVRVIVVVMVVRLGGTGDGFRGGEDEAAGLDPLGADEAVGEFADEPGGASEEDHFEAAAGVEVDVGGRDDVVEVVVLEVG